MSNYFLIILINLTNILKFSNFYKKFIDYLFLYDIIPLYIIINLLMRKILWKTVLILTKLTVSQ